MSVNVVQAKLKKIKEKYGDQDEEERRLRMDILAVSILGAAPGTQGWEMFMSILSHHNIGSS